MFHHVRAFLRGITHNTQWSPMADRVETDLASDDLGRLVVYPYQVRDLVTTGYVALTRAQEGTFMSAVPGEYIDLLEITAANTSLNSNIRVDFRNGTGGSVVHTIFVDVSNSHVMTFPAPLPASEAGAPWTAQVVGVNDMSEDSLIISGVGIRHR